MCGNSSRALTAAAVFCVLKIITCFHQKQQRNRIICTKNVLTKEAKLVYIVNVCECSCKSYVKFHRNNSFKKIVTKTAIGIWQVSFFPKNKKNRIHTARTPAAQFLPAGQGNLEISALLCVLWMICEIRERRSRL